MPSGACLDKMSSWATAFWTNVNTKKGSLCVDLMLALKYCLLWIEITSNLFERLFKGNVIQLGVGGFKIMV